MMSNATDMENTNGSQAQNDPSDASGSGIESISSISDSDSESGEDVYVNDSVIEIIDDVNPSDLSDMDICPPSPIRRRRRNAIFQPVSPPDNTASAAELDEVYHNEIQVASPCDFNENPIENDSSTSGADAVGRGITNTNVQDFRTFIALDGLEALLQDDAAALKTVGQTPEDNNILSVSEECINQGAEADIDAPKSQLSDVESVASIPQTKPEDEDEETASKEKEKTSACVSCKNPAPLNFQFCLRCFRIRRGWLPKRPPSNKLKRRKAEQKRAMISGSRPRFARTGTTINLRALARRRGITLSSTLTSTSLRNGMNNEMSPEDLNEGFLETERAISNPVDSQPSTSTGNEGVENSQQPETPEASLLDFNSQPVSSSQPVVGTSSFSELDSRKTFSQPLPTPAGIETGNSNYLNLQPMCNFCCMRPKDSAFVHNKLAHLVACFTCGDKILKKSGKCPICRERVLRVVRVVVA